MKLKVFNGKLVFLMTEANGKLASKSRETSYNMLRKPGMHGCGSQASAPASDAATREGCHRPRVRAASCHVAIPESGQRG